MRKLSQAYDSSEFTQFLVNQARRRAQIFFPLPLLFPLRQAASHPKKRISVPPTRGNERTASQYFPQLIHHFLLPGFVHSPVCAIVIMPVFSQITKWISIVTWQNNPKAWMNLVRRSLGHGWISQFEQLYPVANFYFWETKVLFEEPL